MVPMYTEEQEPNVLLNINSDCMGISDCFLAAVGEYILSLFGECIDLLQFSWYFSCELIESGEIVIRLVNYDEIKEFIWEKYRISFDFLSNIFQIDIDKIIKTEISKKRPVGLTVDYNRCSWTRKSHDTKYVYHFILIIGYSDKYYWCIDNETTFVQKIKIDVVLDMVSEVLCFDDTEKLPFKNIKYNYFLCDKYWDKRKKMILDIDVIRNIIIQNNDEYSIASKLSLMSQNYDNFVYYLSTEYRNQDAIYYANLLKKNFKMLSLLCLKNKMVKSDTIKEKIYSIVELIKEYENKLRESLRGFS